MTIRLVCADREAAERARAVLAVEAGSTPRRSSVTISVDDDSLEIAVSAEEARTLRATTNSILRLAAVVLDVEAAAEPFKQT